MEAKTPKEFFQVVLPQRFKPDKAKGIDVVVQVNIKGLNGGGWTVTIKDEKIEAAEGTAQSPTVSIGIEEADFIDLVNGRISGERAFFTGKIKFRGNIAVALKLKDTGFL
jgi:putative sterol carrier protein